MTRPYGTWRSPISASMAAASSVRFGAVGVDGDDIYWLESRPSEGGRTVLVRRSPDGTIHDVTPPPFNVRTRVNEYGGGAYVVAEAVAYFSNFADHRIYRLAIHGDAPPSPITPEGPWFFADGVVDSRRRRLICVREDRSGTGVEPATTLVGVPLDGDGGSGGIVIAAGDDFYSTPRLSPDGARLAWICWRHPNMPWNGTELWAAEVTAEGALVNGRCVAGGSDDDAIYQPGWLPDGSLCFASDRDGWWRLYRLGPDSHGPAVPLVKAPPDRTEFGRPQWVFGTATWACAGRDRIVTSFTCDGRWHLGWIDTDTRLLHPLAGAGEPLEWLAATPTHAVLATGAVDRFDAVVQVALESGHVEVLRRLPIEPAVRAVCSPPETVEFPTDGGRVAYAFHYAPRHPGCSAPAVERPPLIVIGHGGPTTATRDTLDLKVQFWTSRGFAVVDVNYGGSSGYGRDYRRQLNGQWGVLDVADMIHAARHLVEQGKADPNRLIIRGGSAGGFTALAALTSHPNVFRAGASYYGICDLEVLARDTHKFEARYLDTLVGPYPAMRHLYRERSPIHFVDRLSCALILFQGLEDTVVPPNQSEMMADAVRAKGLPVAYLTFPGEQHGFRKRETITRSLEAELYFYGAVFGFAIDDAVEALPIDNL